MIKIKCSSSHNAKLDELLPFQGGLKDLSETNFRKLKQQILDEGFIVPFFVWQEYDQYFLLDGHQRHFVLRAMRDEGIKMPDAFPIVLVEADSFKQACKRVLAISSQYGTMTKKGLKDFLVNADITDQDAFEEYQFDAIDFEKFEDKVKEEKDAKEYSFGLFIKCSDSNEQAELLQELKERNLEVKIKNI